MKTVYMSRAGRSEYTVEEIAKALASLNSFEDGDVNGQGAAVTYFLHIDDKGNVLADKDGEEECFVKTIGCEDYGLDEKDWKDVWDSSFLPDHESLECEAFRDAAEDLTDQINSWLKENA